jgi:ubiquinone/menaquinone biosynthesis C-methylase UbiE
MSRNNLVSKTIQTYNTCAESYFHDHYDISEVRDVINFFIQNLKGTKILDVGCGPGRDVKYFSNHNLKVTGVDLSDRFLDIASKNVPGAKFIQMDMRSLDFSDNTFDGIWASVSFLHIQKKDAVDTLIGLRRILKSDGLMYINVEKGTQEKFLRKEEYKNKPRLISFYTEGEFEELIKTCGFNILKKVVDEDPYGWIKVFATKKSIQSIYKKAKS